MKKLSFILLYSYILASPLYSQWTDAYIPDFKVNDDPGTALQSGSRIGVDSAGNFVVVWADERNQVVFQVYCQRYTRSGLTIGNNFRIGHDTTGRPSIEVLKDGRFVVVWAAITFNYTKVDYYFQRFSSQGQAIGIPVKILDSTLSYGWGDAIDSDLNGNFIITLSTIINSQYPRVYFQRYDSSGNRIGTLQVVNEANSRAQQPDIAVNDDGSFVICWQDDRLSIQLGQDDIFMQRYNSIGVKIGNNVKVNEGTNTRPIL